MKIIDVKKYSKDRIPMYGNTKKFIVIHYLGVVGENCAIEANGCGAHFYIYWNGDTYQACDEDAIVWQVGTAGGAYTQKHPEARNENCIGIEFCVKCDGNQNDPKDPKWYFTEETQKAGVELVKYLMKKHNIPIENVIMHNSVVNKWCPAPYLNNNKYKTTWTWKEFKAKLKQEDNVVNISLKQINAGDIGKEVLLMQKLLKAEGHYKGALDGSFGMGTYNAVRAYQISAKLTVDGVCGVNTWHSLLGM